MKFIRCILFFLFAFLYNLQIGYCQVSPYVDSLKQVISGSPDDTNKIKAMILLGWELKNFNPDTSILMETHALKLMDEISIRHEKGMDSLMMKMLRKWTAIAKGHLGAYSQMKGDYAKALILHFEALRIDREIGNKKGQAKHLGNIGVVYIDLGDYNHALDYLFRALKMDEELAKSSDLATAKYSKQGLIRHFGNIGIVYEEQAEATVGQTQRRELFNKALEYYQKGLDVSAQLGDKRSASNIYGNIGVVYRQMGEWDKSLRYYQRALALDEETGNKVGIARHLGNIGNSYGSKIKNASGPEIRSLRKKALDYYFKALKIKFELGNKIEIATTLGNIGYTYWEAGDFYHAEKYLKQALRMAEEIRSLRLKKDVNAHLSRLYQDKGDWKTAFDYFKNHVDARDSINNDENTRRRTQLEMQYEFDKKDAAEKVEQDKKDDQAKNELKRQQLIRNSVILFGAIGFAFTGLLFNRFKLKKKIESQQAIINERKRISHELHDDLGVQLSTARLFLTSLNNTTDKEKNWHLVENSLHLIDGSIRDLRKIMDDLQVSTLHEKGYIAATEELVNRINQLRQIHFTLAHHGMDKRPDPATEHHFFRITQELINNSLKYAQAKNVHIDLVNRDGKLILMYEDDGVGFDLNQVKRGYGLENISSRIHSLGGSIEFDSKPGFGTRVSVEVPV